MFINDLFDNKKIQEAANAAQQAAIAINMKKHHQKPKDMKEAEVDEMFGFMSPKKPSPTDYATKVSSAPKKLTKQDYDELMKQSERPKGTQVVYHNRDEYVKDMQRRNIKPATIEEEDIAEGERNMSRAAKGVMKYGKDGMKALAKAGREGASDEKLDTIRDKYDHYNESVAEDSEKRCMQCGMKNCSCTPGKCKCKPVAGWVPGKGFKKAMEEAALNEKWSQKYKSSINCSHPKGFSQKAHCAGKKKHNEDITMEMTCPDCGMCQTHGNLNEIKKGQKDSNGYTKCWPGKHAEGTKKSSVTGKQVRNCVPNKGVKEGHADQQRKIFKKNGKPVGEVGIDRESSPGNGQWYMKCYAYDIDNAGYDSYEEAVEELKHCLKQGVAEGSEQKYLWHGSRQKIPMLEPRQSVDTGGATGSNQNAIYATSDPKVAIAMGLTTPGSDTGMFPNDPQMVLFKGNIRKGKNVYLHKVPFNGPDGKPQFVQGGNSREFHTIPGVKGIKPVEIKAVPVNKYLNLIRQATPADLELQKKYMKQGVAEGSLEEIDRRGFLKGLGAAAVAGAGISGAENVSAKSFDEADYQKIIGMLYLYMACKGPYSRELARGNTVTVPVPVCQKAKELISKFIKQYPNGREWINNEYAGLYNYEQEQEKQNPNRPHALNKIYFVPAFQEKILRDFESLIEFGESVEQGVAEGGAETSWSNDTDTITLQDILELTKHIKQINLPINDNLKSKLLHWEGNPEEIERVNQVTVSNQFPILIMVNEQGQIEWILDGNHRLHKAIQSQAKTIPAKLIRPNNLNDKAKKIFNIKEQGVAEGHPEDDDDHECYDCRGTGEGQHEGTSCRTCGGTGVARPDHEEDDSDYEERLNYRRRFRESKIYYNVVGTPAAALREQFGMRKDRNGWYLKETAGRKRILEAHKAFGNPLTEGMNLAAYNGSTAIIGDGNAISPVGSNPRRQQELIPTRNSKAKKNGRIS